MAGDHNAVHETMADETLAMETKEEVEIELSKGLEQIFQGGNGLFYKCEIHCNSLFDIVTKQLAPSSADTNSQTLNLSSLNGLRQGRRWFIPDTIFIRSEMKVMFTELLTKAHDAEVRKVLTGSPGIGKSVIFFLSALLAQLLHPQKKVAYIRKTDEEEDISFFLMEPGDIPGTVKVVFSREISKSDHETLFTMWKEFRSYTNVLKTKDYITFLDGPKYHETLDLLNNGYHYLCTSGGYPPRSQDAILATDVKILTGWREQDIIKALSVISEKTKEEAAAIYSLSGGRIRLALWGSYPGGVQKIKVYYDELIFALGQDKIALAVQKTDSSAATDSSDRLRTRFLDYDGKGTSLLIVDSFYAMTKLRARLDFADFMISYHLAGACGLQSARGWFFEEIMHLWFRNSGTTTPLVTSWVRSEGTAIQGVHKLNQENMYWIPATSNFANIDAAFVYKSILICLQYTVQTQHSFNPETFWTEFACQVHSVVQFQNIEIWFVSPQNTSFVMTHENYWQDYSGATEIALRSQGNISSMQVLFKSAEVTCDSVDTLNATVPRLGFFPTR